MSKRPAPARCREIARQITALHDEVRKDLVRHPSKPWRKTREENPILLLRYRIGKLIEEYRQTFPSKRESGYGAKWADRLSKEIGERLGQAELYAMRRYSLSFSEGEVKSHVRRGLAWSKARDRFTGKPRLYGLDAKHSANKRGRAKPKMRKRVGAGR